MRLDLTKPFALLLDVAANATNTTAPKNHEEPAGRAVLTDGLAGALAIVVMAAAITSFLFRKKIAVATQQCFGFFGSSTTHSSETPSEQRRLLNDSEASQYNG